MALIEAMASGLPCIGTKVGGIPGLLEDGAGVVVPARDPSAIAAEMMRRLRDRSLRCSLTHRARQKVANGDSLSQPIERYLQLLRSPLGPTTGSTHRLRGRKSGPACGPPRHPGRHLLQGSVPFARGPSGSFSRAQRGRRHG